MWIGIFMFWKTWIWFEKHFVCFQAKQNMYWKIEINIWCVSPEKRAIEVHFNQ